MILSAGHENFIYTEGYNQDHNKVKFWLETANTVWDQDYNQSQQSLQNIITTLNFAHAYNYYNTGEDEIPIPYSNQAGIWGLTHVLSSPAGYYPSGLYFGYGLYRANFGWNYYDFPLISFYLDYRDCDYTQYFNGNNDIWIKFNATDNSVKIDWNDDNFTDNVTQVIPYGYYTIWDVKNKSIRNDVAYTFYFDQYWQRCLVLIPSSNNHPHLVWGAHPTFNATNYRIYRAVSNYPVKPITLNYTRIATVSSSTFDYIDYAVTILPGSQYAYYYVVGWNGTTESDKTNYVNTPAEFHKAKADTPEENNVYQNYPNPFNPTTNIHFSIGNGKFVTLKVYDVLGNEVATLVNEWKEAGSYEVTFKSNIGIRQLATGAYIYRLQAGNFVKTKKMLLLE